MTEEEFRQKYPHSTDDQVRLYCEMVRAEQQGVRPIVEPDIPMPLITVPAPRRIVPSVAPVTTYSAKFFIRNFSLADAPPSEAAAPPEAEPANCAAELRAILLGSYGFHTALSSEAKQRLAETDMTEEEMLALLVGAPSAREFVNLA